MALVVVCLGILVLTLRLEREGKEHMARSDRAFHRGELSLAVLEAKSALLAFVPGAAHVGRAEDRLVAIARGAEAEGRLELARTAWDALRVGEERTSYPGKGVSERAVLAHEGLRRIDQKLEGRAP